MAGTNLHRRDISEMHLQGAQHIHSRLCLRLTSPRLGAGTKGTAGPEQLTDHYSSHLCVILSANSKH